LEGEGVCAFTVKLRGGLTRDTEFPIEITLNPLMGDNLSEETAFGGPW